MIGGNKKVKPHVVPRFNLPNQLNSGVNYFQQDYAHEKQHNTVSESETWDNAIDGFFCSLKRRKPDEIEDNSIDLENEVAEQVIDSSQFVGLDECEEQYESEVVHTIDKSPQQMYSYELVSRTNETIPELNNLIDQQEYGNPQFSYETESSIS